jgi:hypothetical protein
MSDLDPNNNATATTAAEDSVELNWAKAETGLPTKGSSYNRFTDEPQKKWQEAWALLSERANPIVVKEARQALNSRQFVFAFSLTLVAVLCWTVMAVVMQLPELYYVPGGMTLLSGYMVILACPLLLIIPYSAYRSMVVEAEDRTFELVSISALSAQQIVNGKMYSSLLQIIVYLATLSPGFVITYLLRGVLLSSIVYYLVFTLQFSIALTGLSILAAALGRSKFLQVLSSIAVLAGLMFCFVYWSAFTVNTLEMWNLGDYGPAVVIALSTVVAALVPVCLRSSTAAIDFASENNATPLRLRLALFVLVCKAWGIYAAAASGESGWAYVFLFGGLAMFLIMGALMTSELGIISPRAQRTLPKTVMGRVFTTWYFPGAGLGYVFLVCLYTSYLTGWFALSVAPAMSINSRLIGSEISAFCVASWGYFVFYCGLNRLLMLAIPRHVQGRMLIGLLLQGILISLGVLIPFLIMLLVTGFREFPYDWHQFSNLFWTFSLLERSSGASIGSSLLLLVLCAVGVFGLNLLLCGRDVLLIRTRLPNRLQEELNKDQIVPPAAPDPFA